MARVQKPAKKTTAKKTTAAKKKTAKKVAGKPTKASSSKAALAAKKPAKKTAKKRAAKKEFDIDAELSVENLLARGQELEVERRERAAREATRPRTVRDPVAARPSNPVHWGYPFCLDAAIPEPERGELAAWFGRFVELSDEPRSGFFVVAPDTDPERRRAAWDAGGVVIEVEALRAQMPSDDPDERRERMERVLARPSGEGWSELAMLLTTWDDAGFREALAAAERTLVDWPDELRTKIDAWNDRPELLRLVRVHWGEIDERGPPAGITTLRTQDIDALVAHQDRFAQITYLEISGRSGLPDVALGLTALTNLERLVLHQPTYNEGTADIDLPALLAAPHLRGLKGLHLYGYTPSIADLEALAACEQPLELLKIQYGRMPPEAGRPLAALAARRRLRSLDLKYNDLGPEGAELLFASPDDWSALRVLDISANEIGDAGVEALARAGLGELRWLCISSNDPKNQLTAAAAEALATAPSLGNLETLFLHGHPIGAEGVTALLHSPYLRGLRRLNVGFPSASLEQIVARRPTVDPVDVVELNLGHLDASKTKKLDLSAATFLRTVRSLSLDSLDGAEYGPVLACPHLESLEVLILGGGYSNPKKAFAALTSATPPPNLRYLGLSGWKLTPEQAAALTASPLGQQLWGVDLMASYTTPDAWHALYHGGLPLAGSPLFDPHAPSEYATSTTFREEI
jgi:hypothetical protein